MTLRSLILGGILLLPLAAACSQARSESALTPDGGRYTGPLVNGLRQGQGRVEWDSGMRYEGSFEAGLYAGRGRLQLSSGSVYDGEFRQGMMSGQGHMTMPDGSVYQGLFRDGHFHGRGRYEMPGLYVYEGDFEKGVMQGQGRLSDPAGVYEGEFRQGLYWGRGEIAYKDGRKYSGGFERNLFHGKGRFETPAGEVFEGDFQKGEFTGQGRYIARDGRRHEGSFLNWRPQGPGNYVDPGANRFEGDFSEGRLKQGRMTNAEGLQYEGELMDFRPHGQGTLRLPNGDVYTGGFAYGFYEGEGRLTYARPGPDGRGEISGVWRYGELPDPEAERKAKANIETALYGQRALLDQALAALQARAPDRINLFLLTVAGDGKQEVFRRETDFVRRQFDESFGTQGHSLSLVNSRETVATAPLATLTSLRESMARFATLMDKERDILFLFLTSHGSRNHEFVLDQEDMDMADLEAAELGRMLRDSGIRWKVVVVSACYSGGFIDALKDDHTLVITAARHDRSSFGCSDENEFTYFGHAFFKEALPRSRSFQDAFRRAEKLIRQWEKADLAADAAQGKAEEGEPARAEEEHYSLPQMVGTPAIEAQLKQWWRQRSRPAAGAERR